MHGHETIGVVWDGCLGTTRFPKTNAERLAAPPGSAAPCKTHKEQERAGRQMNAAVSLTYFAPKQIRKRVALSAWPCGARRKFAQPE